MCKHKPILPNLPDKSPFSWKTENKLRNNSVTHFGAGPMHSEIVRLESVGNCMSLCNFLKWFRRNLIILASLSVSFGNLSCGRCLGWEWKSKVTISFLSSKINIPPIEMWFQYFLVHWKINVLVPDQTFEGKKKKSFQFFKMTASSWSFKR